MTTLKNIIINPRFVFFSLIILTLILSVRMSFDAGISGDEFRHHEQAGKVYNYFQSKGEDEAALKKTGRDPMQYNGQSFDNLMYFIEKQFGIEDYMGLRHFFNSVIGWLIILITGLIVKEIAGYRGAILAVFLLFISPRFIGHVPNNNKDIPFALGFIASIYGILLFLKQLPKPTFKTLAILTLGIAYAISIRMAGILSICFLGLFSAIYYLIYPPVKSPFSRSKRLLVARLVVYILPIVILSYFLGIISWPFMLEAPLKNIPVILKAMSLHPISIKQLFEGQIYESSALPWYYILKYMYISYPSIMFLGIALFFILYFRFRKQYSFIQLFTILFSLVFVIVWMSYENSNVYNGIRHILFIYPLIVVISAIGFTFLYKSLNKYLEKPIRRYAFYGLLIIISFHPIRHLIVNYPYAYIYFNELSGGIKKAYGNYETDYFQHSLRHASNWLIRNELKDTPDNKSIKITTNEASNVGYYFRSIEKNIEVDYSRYYEKSNDYWDYGIFYCSYIDPFQLKNNLWPPAGTIHTEDVDGIPIAAVVKRVSYEDFEGYQSLKNNRLREAEDHFKEYLKTDPNNEEAYYGLAEIEMRRGHHKKVIEYTDKALDLSPRFFLAHYSKGIASNYLENYKTAIECFNKIIEIKRDFHEAYYHKAYALYMQEKPNVALESLNIAVNYKKDYYSAFLLIGDIMMNYGEFKKAEEQVYKHILTFKENDFLTKVKLANCYFFQNKIQEAKEILTELRKVEPYNLDVVKLATRIDIYDGQLEQANRYLGMMRGIQNNSELFVIRALYDLRQKNIDSAKANLDKATKLFHNNREAKNILARINAQEKKKEPQKSIMFKKNEQKNTVNVLNL